MKKITTSAAVLAALFLSTNARAGFERLGGSLDTTGGFHQFLGCRDCELQAQRNDQAMQQITQATADAQQQQEDQAAIDQGADSDIVIFPGDDVAPVPIKTKINVPHDVCGVKHLPLNTYQNCDCSGRKWGCEGAVNQNKPVRRQFSGSEQLVGAAIVPAVVHETIIQTNATSEECRNSNGLREKLSHSRWRARGHLNETNVEASRDYGGTDDQFFQCGDSDDYSQEHEARHDIDCGACQFVRSQDVLAFDNQCDCSSYNKAHHEEVWDAEKDVNKRVMGEIYKSIGGVLNNIIQGVFNDAFEHAVELQDNFDE